MAYSIKEAKKIILNTCNEFTKKNLIARTWGDISVRLNENQFLIIADDAFYENIDENSFVVTNICDSSFEGKRKPSISKNLHAAIYKLRKNVDIIVHTHQNYASAISVEGIGFPFAPIAKYALPSSKDYIKNIIKCFSDNVTSDVALLERHGVIILGKTITEVFKKAFSLEEDALKEYQKKGKEKGREIENKPYLLDYAEVFGFSRNNYLEDSKIQQMVRFKNNLAARYQSVPKPLNSYDVFRAHLAYKKHFSKFKDKKDKEKN